MQGKNTSSIQRISVSFEVMTNRFVWMCVRVSVLSNGPDI